MIAYNEKHPHMDMLKSLSKLATYTGFAFVLNGTNPTYGVINTWEDIRTQEDLESVFFKLQVKFAALGFGLRYNLANNRWEVSTYNSRRPLEPVDNPVDTTGLERDTINTILRSEERSQEVLNLFCARAGALGYCILQGNPSNNCLCIYSANDLSARFINAAREVLRRARNGQALNQTISSIWIFLRQYLLSHGKKLIFGYRVFVTPCSPTGPLQIEDVSAELRDLHRMLEESQGDMLLHDIPYAWQGFLEDLGFLFDWNEGLGTWTMYDENNGDQSAWEVFDRTATPINR